VKAKVLIANGGGRVIDVDSDPPGTAVLGKNVFYLATDGSLVLIDPTDVLNNTPVNLAKTLIKAPAGGAGTFGNTAAPSKVLSNTDNLPEGKVNLYFTDLRAYLANHVFGN
jgi:hypothetical protein